MNNQHFELAAVTQYRFSSKDMNQHRWTCLATVVLTTVIGPIANVRANTLSAPVMGSGSSYVPVSPQSLPTITPLVVTELDTEVVIPVTINSVPKVSRLPIVTPLNRKNKAHFRSKQHKPVSTQNQNLVPQSPVTKLPSVPVFNSHIRVVKPLVATFTPTETLAAVVYPVAPLAPISTVPKSQVFASSISPTQTVATIGSPIDRQLKIDSLPQVASIASYPKDTRDVPTFESGVPVFGINNERTPQIVNTVIAQVGDTIVAPEPSIAIPVKLPNQPTTPTKLPVSAPPLAQPQATGTVKIQPAATIKPATEIVKIQPPTATIKPTLDKIVATQSGQASWYGIEGGTQTANGERYIPSGLTAAHRTLPFGTKVRVTSLKTGKTVTVRINDRGPFHSRRIIDVSAGAAEVIGIKNDGIGDVKMEVLAKEG
jgi:rare lipoprotein A